FVGIEEIAVAALMAEEQPVLADRPRRPAIEQEGAERRYTGAGPDHDDRRLLVPRQREAVGLLHIDLQLIARIDTLGQEGRRQPEPLTLTHDIATTIDRQTQYSSSGPL